MQPSESADAKTLGLRIRHLRKNRGLTLGDLGALVERAPSQVSMIENGHREPPLPLLRRLADALGTTVADLLLPEAPSRRAALEIALDRAQADHWYRNAGLPVVRPGSRLPTEVLESLVGLHAELQRRTAVQAVTPEGARRANVELRRQMRSRDNYDQRIEHQVQELLDKVDAPTGPLTIRTIQAIAAQIGFTLHTTAELPASTRSVADLHHRRIYVPQPRHSPHEDPRYVILQAFGHFLLDHGNPLSYGDFLRQRVEANYFAAAALIPESTAAPFLQDAQQRRDLAIEDLRDMYGVSYETAAHRFTNLATRHLSIPVHFARVHQSGTIYKAYENDGMVFPTDATGAIEGQVACRKWATRTVFTRPQKLTSHDQYTDTPSGTYWCTSQIESTTSGDFSVSVGVPFDHVKWFRGRDTKARMSSGCPDPACCTRPPSELAERWDGYAWPSARTHSHLLAALPPGQFPGVNLTEVYAFLDEASQRPDA